MANCKDYTIRPLLSHHYTFLLALHYSLVDVARKQTSKYCSKVIFMLRDPHSCLNHGSTHYHNDSVVDRSLYSHVDYLFTVLHPVLQMFFRQVWRRAGAEN